MINLYLVRHLKTEWNKYWLCQWWKWWKILNDSYLSYEEVIEFLKKEEIDYIFSSDLSRAKITSVYIKNQLWFKKNINYSYFFREINFWIFEGQDCNLIKKVQPYIYDSNWFFKYNVKLKNGESVNDLRERVFKWLDLLKEKRGIFC